VDVTKSLDFGHLTRENHRLEYRVKAWSRSLAFVLAWEDPDHKRDVVIFFLPRT
jgi:hypothetical protein